MPSSFPPNLRLKGPATFRAHYDLGHRETAGPLVALALASTHPHTRIGFSTPKKLGPAPTRNRARRLLREAFRLSRDTHPKGVDIVLLVRPHDLKSLQEYQSLLAKLLDRITKKQSTGPLPSPPQPK